MKRCTKCGAEKDESEFHKQSKCKNGLNPRCKKCRTLIDRKRYENNTDKAKQNAKNWSTNNPDRYKQIKNNWKANNIDKIKQDKKNWNTNNPDKVLSNAKNSREQLMGCYCYRMLKASGFSKEQITAHPELIELKRIIIKTKRLCKTSMI